MTKNELHEYIAQNQENICAITALKNGETAYCDFWHDYRMGDTVQVASVTKSVVSLLVGIALDQGLIQDVAQPILDFFPNYKLKRGEKTIRQVTVEHLLTMTAPWKYRSEPWTRVCISGDWTVASLDLLGGRSGLTGAFRYSTVCIHILTGILAQVSGMNTVEFANQYLFEPIGAAPHYNYIASTVEEHRTFILSKNPKGDIWFADPKGIGTAGYGLCLSAEDMAKIGQLCLNGGSWDGKRIVSSGWLKESTRPRHQCGEEFGNMSYGYLWWTPENGSSVYAAIGDGGNIIYIDPLDDVVVAVAGTFKPRIFDRVSFIKQYILPMTDKHK